MSKWASEERDVLAPLGEGRQPDLDAAQPVVEILAQAPLFDHDSRFAIRRRDEANTHPLGLLRPDRPHLAVVDHAQELRLEAQVEGLELVEKEHALVRLAQQPAAVAVGAGERAAPVAEELALEEIRGRERAVVGHEGSLREPGMCVDRARDELLAGPRRPGHEHVDVAARRHQDAVANLDHRAARPDELGHRRMGRARPLARQQRAIDAAPTLAGVAGLSR